MAHSKGQIMLGNGSSTAIGSGSSGSSPDIFVGDCRLLTISITSSTGSASKITVLGTNEQGFQTAINAGSYSVMTVLPNQGLYTIDPGVRWIRIDRADIAINAAGSTASNTTVALNRYYE